MASDSCSAIVAVSPSAAEARCVQHEQQLLLMLRLDERRMLHIGVRIQQRKLTPCDVL